jgi:holin-like protein
MISALTTLLIFQTLGEGLSFALKLPVPGPVLGMVLLLAYLRLRPSALAALRPTCTHFLRHLSLLFVPAGVGVMLHGARLASEWGSIVVALVLSSALSIGVTAWVIDWARRRRNHAA